MASQPAVRHEVVAHTADIGIRAVAPTLPLLLDEAAAALAEVAASVKPGVDADIREMARVSARDLPAATFAWLNELVGLADAHHAALLDAHVQQLGETPDGVAVEGEARLVRYRPGRAAPRHAVKSVSLHRLEVRRGDGGWRLLAFLDL